MSESKIKKVTTKIGNFAKSHKSELFTIGYGVGMFALGIFGGYGMHNTAVLKTGMNNGASIMAEQFRSYLIGTGMEATEAKELIERVTTFKYM